jgi:hypothetical protein
MTNQPPDPPIPGSGGLTPESEAEHAEGVRTLVQLLIAEGMARAIAPGTAAMAALEYLALSIVENFPPDEAPDQVGHISGVLRDRVQFLSALKHAPKEGPHESATATE